MKTREITEVNGTSRIAQRSNGVGAYARAARGALFRLGTALLACGAFSACSERQGTAVDVPTLESGGDNPCQQRVASWQAQQATITGSKPAERLTQIRAAAEKVGEDPEGCTANLIDSALADELRKVLVLQSAGRSFPAPVIYTCPQLSDGTRCSGRSADDTAQLGEFPVDDVAVPAGAQASAVVMPDFPINPLQWYRALDSALLENPAAATPLAVQADGSLELPKAGEANLVFAIGRGPSGEFHKWVWVLQ